MADGDMCELRVKNINEKAGFNVSVKAASKNARNVLSDVELEEIWKIHAEHKSGFVPKRFFGHNFSDVKVGDVFEGTSTKGFKGKDDLLFKVGDVEELPPRPTRGRRQQNQGSRGNKKQNNQAQEKKRQGQKGKMKKNQKKNTQQQQKKNTQQQELANSPKATKNLASSTTKKKEEPKIEQIKNENKESSSSSSSGGMFDWIRNKIDGGGN